jgi:hypothetical protein
MTWRDASLGVWAFLGFALVGLIVAAVWSARVAKPGELLRALVAGRWRRAGCVLGWMWLGWHLFAR